jgi:catechol 2,3-dioxygenase-like lactoylglutathione lyase family enzyme
MNLNQITISVADVEKSIEFYENLGLRLIVKSLPKYARFESMQGETTFSLHQSLLTNNGGTWLYFEIENLDQKVAELLQKGFVFEELPTDKEWLWREASMKDLDNNQLILFYAGVNRKNPPWRIQ